MVNHRASWELRPLDEEENDEDFYNIYDARHELFTIKVHYKGLFNLTPLREYKGGHLRIIDQVNEDFFNLTDVDVIALGAWYKYKSYLLYLWRIPLTSLDNGLRPLQCDDDVTEFLYHASYFKFMEIYFDHDPLISIERLFGAVAPTVEIMELEMEEQLENDVNFQGHVEQPEDEASNSHEEVENDEVVNEEARNEEENEPAFDMDDEEALAHTIWGDQPESEEEIDDFQFIEDEEEEEAAQPEDLVGAPITAERNDQVMRDDPMIVEAELGDGGGYIREERPILITRVVLEEILADYDDENNVDEETIQTVMQEDSMEALRKLKGKEKVGEGISLGVHRRVRFTQGTSVDEVVDEVEDDQEYINTQEGELVLDGHGDPVQQPHDDDYQFYIGNDQFDNAELEDEIVIERWESEGVQENVQQEVKHQFANYEAMDDAPSTVQRSKQHYLSPYERYKRAANETEKSRIVDAIDSDAEVDNQTKEVLDDMSEDDMDGHSTDDGEKDPVVIPFKPLNIMNPKIEVNLVFSSKDEAKEAMRWYALNERKPIKCILNDKRRLKFVCEFPCTWGCLISPSVCLGPKDFKVKKLSIRHENCPHLRTRMGNNVHMAKAFEDLISTWTDIELSILEVAINQKFGLVMSTNVVRATKVRVLKRLKEITCTTTNYYGTIAASLEGHTPGALL